MEKQKEELIIKNVQVSKRIAKWFEDKSFETGVSQSALMLMALNFYVDQKKFLYCPGRNMLYCPGRNMF